MLFQMVYIPAISYACVSHDDHKFRGRPLNSLLAHMVSPKEVVAENWRFDDTSPLGSNK